MAECRGGNFGLRRRGESGGGPAREYAVMFERKLMEIAVCDIIGYEKKVNLLDHLPKASLG